MCYCRGQCKSLAWRERWLLLESPDKNSADVLHCLLCACSACHQQGSFISNMNPAVFLLVAKEEFAKGHKNTATLLGLCLRPQEGSGGADRMFFFSPSWLEKWFPCGCHLWMELNGQTAGTLWSGTTAPVSRGSSITQHHCHLWPETEGGWERERLL